MVGANHRSSSLAVRDRLFVEDEAVSGFLARLRQVGIAQALVLSTCDRVEVQAIGEDRETASRRIRGVLSDHAGLKKADLDAQLYVFWGDDAVRHVFMVTAALDSMIIGEPQILGQVKACHRMARDAGMSGSDLEALMQAAYGAAKRVRSDTAIGQRPVSMAAAAVLVARDVHGDLGRAACLLVGAGDMGRMVAENLLAGGGRSPDGGPSDGSPVPGHGADPGMQRRIFRGPVRPPGRRRHRGHRPWRTPPLAFRRHGELGVAPAPPQTDVPGGRGRSRRHRPGGEPHRRGFPL